MKVFSIFSKRKPRRRGGRFALPRRGHIFAPVGRLLFRSNLK